MNTFKERSNYLKAISLMSIFTFIFLGIESLFVDMISLLVSENRVVLSQNYVLGMSCLGFILYPLYNRKICIVISTTIIGLITIFYLHTTYPLKLLTGLVLFLFLGGLGGITSSSYWNKRYGSQKGSWGNLIDSFKENTKVKTGDNTKYMIYMGFIGLSLLGAYCIIMKNYIH